MNTVQDLGCALVLMRPDNIYVSRDGQKIKFKSLKGVSKINDIGKVKFLTKVLCSNFLPLAVAYPRFQA